MEIALRIHEADADERHAEVAGFLAVIAGQHAEAAGVDRQRLMQRELGGEVGDLLADEIAVLAMTPGVVRRPHRVEASDRGIVVGEPLGAGHCALEHVGRQQLQHPHRVVRGAAPERIVELPKHVARRRGPTPPEIARKRLQAVDAFRK